MNRTRRTSLLVLLLALAVVLTACLPPKPGAYSRYRLRKRRPPVTRPVAPRPPPPVAPPTTARPTTTVPPTTTTTTTTVPPTTTTTVPPDPSLPGPACVAAPATAAAVGPELSVGSAGLLAARAVLDVTDRMPDGSVPLVVTEVVGGAPRISVDRVRSVGEAVRIAELRASDGGVVGVDTAVRVDASQVPYPAPGDPMQGDQWALARLGAPTVWQSATGSGVTVAVVDSGVQPDHPDLMGQMVPGHAFTGAGSESEDTSDTMGHGTHVAGIVAAARNGVGTVGLAYGAKVMPLRVFDRAGAAWDSDVARGVVWAVDHGAKVVNMSLGVTVATEAMAGAVQYAQSKGVLLVASAGNSGPCAKAVYPAAYRPVVAVGALQDDYTAASYTSTGNYVDVAAPGSMVASTYPTALDPEGYRWLSGTSMAAPHVAAAAALVWSANPGWSPGQVREALESSADDVMVPGKDQWSGAGGLDVRQALGL